MIFRNIILTSLLLGLLAGSLLTLLQMVAVNPIIFAAEAYEEKAAPEVAHSHSHDHSHAHSHDDEAWAPADGFERSGYSFVANVLAAIGFAAMLLAIMSQLQLQGLTQLSLSRGLLWGLAGFGVFFLMPALGLPPEIPGVEAAAIENRQTWWLLAVVAGIAGLVLLAFAPAKYKLIGPLLLALPFIVGAPHIGGPEFSHSDPQAVTALTALHQQFIVASGLSNLLFWLALGPASVWCLQRWIVKSAVMIGADRDSAINNATNSDTDNDTKNDTNSA